MQNLPAIVGLRLYLCVCLRLYSFYLNLSRNPSVLLQHSLLLPLTLVSELHSIFQTHMHTHTHTHTFLFAFLDYDIINMLIKLLFWYWHNKIIFKIFLLKMGFHICSFIYSCFIHKYFEKDNPINLRESAQRFTKSCAF